MGYIKTFESYNNNLIDFNTFPKDVKATLEDEYGHYFLNNFDWNDMQDEHGEGFNQWSVQNKSDEFKKNINLLIQKTRADLITLKRKQLSEKALEYFEDLIKPTLGNEVLTEPLSIYMQYALYNNHSIEDLNKAYLDVKNIIDSDGSINVTKTTASEIFIGDDISLPNFERFAKNNPEYLGVFNDWKKLFDEHTELLIKDLNAFRSSTPYNKIKELYEFLLSYRS
jgi:hypothetical protein